MGDPGSKRVRERTQLPECERDAKPTSCFCTYVPQPPRPPATRRGVGWRRVSAESPRPRAPADVGVPRRPQRARAPESMGRADLAGIRLIKLERPPLRLEFTPVKTGAGMTNSRQAAGNEPSWIQPSGGSAAPCTYAGRPSATGRGIDWRRVSAESPRPRAPADVGVPRRPQRARAPESMGRADLAGIRLIKLERPPLHEGG
jgi:hypothetical protein